MNKDIYRSAIDNIQFSQDLSTKVLNYLMSQPQKRAMTIKAKPTIATLAVVICVLFLVFCIPLFSNGNSDFELKNSRGNVRVKYVDNVPDSALRSSSQLMWLTEEELFHKWNTSIFKGAVEEIRNIRIDFNGSTEYRAIARIKIDKVYRGDESAGQVVSVLLPSPVGTGLWIEDTDVISAMRVGMTGIFMPIKYDDTFYWEQNDTKLFWSDIAEYGFLDGMRFAFLVSDSEGIIFEREAYPSIAAANSLDEIERYIMQMLNINR